MPYLLRRERYVGYAIALIGTILIATQFNIWYFNYLIDFLFPDYYFISYHSRPVLLIIFAAFLLGTTLIRLAEDWIYYNRNQNRELKRQKEQIQLQLTSLRSQINPHFLFNSLNVIYALALDRKETATRAIVQLSDILRYIIYDSNLGQVPLKEEITLLNNYLDFQKFRKREAEKVNFDSRVEDDNYPMYPMLLLPLVENAFKHGAKTKTSEPFLHIKLEQQGETLAFSIANRVSEGPANGSAGQSGVGLANVRINLELVYPNAHEFRVSKKDGTFEVVLKLFSKCALHASS
jgi:sensor histidine kinase YesM